MQEFWQALGRADMTIYERSWYTAAARRLLYTDKEDLAKSYEASIHGFEKQLAADGYVIVKFFVHISQDAQEKRLRRLHKTPTPAGASRNKSSSTSKTTTSPTPNTTTSAPQRLRLCPLDHGEREDKRTANLTICKTLVKALENALDAAADPAAEAAAKKAAQNSAGMLQAADPRDRSDEESARVLEAALEAATTQSTLAPTHSRFTIVPRPPRVEEIDHTLTLTREEYVKALKKEQKRLGELELKMYRARIPLMLLYEGDDAAGKGGNIKRVAQAIDARAYTVFPSPAPTKPELLHPHLWRYWTRLPRLRPRGIYDRSWYGRVLVERVEGFASPAEWSRAYDEINEFERQLEVWGAILLKFWVAVDPDEQLRRFTERETNPDKQWKITPEDWRNRDKHPQYAAAANDMFRLTSTEYAPWIVLESTNKYYARIKALRIINETLEKRLGLR
ncbi:MAG: polyphosphate--AMP phosphotransferase [Eggerthellaceae bacterium]